jgi:hypothetical protein
MKNTMNIPIRTLSIVGLIAGLATSAQAALIDADSAFGSTDGHSSRTASNLINGSEMSSSGDVNDYSTWSMAAGTSQAGNNVAWQADGSNDTHWAIIDLGAVYNLDTISIWNLNPDTTTSTYTGREAKTVNVWYSITGVGSNVALSDAEFNSTGYTSLSTALSVSKNPGATGPIATPNARLTGLTGVQAQWVAIEITDNWGTANHGKKGSLSEVQFFGTIPEPSSYALLAGCFGLTWVMLRRRR